MPANAASVACKAGTAVLIFVNAANLANESGIAAVETPKSIWALLVPSKEDVDAIFALFK